MKVDLHARILPRDWPDLAERYGYGGWIQLEHHSGPFPLGEHHPGTLIESMALSKAQKEQLLSATALEFLGLKRETFETPASRTHSASLEEPTT